MLFVKGRIVLLAWALAGCAASSSEGAARTRHSGQVESPAAPEEPTAQEDVMLLAVLESGGSPSGAASEPSTPSGPRSPRPERPPVVLPAHHVVAPIEAARGELADGEAAYARLLALPLGPAAAANVPDTVAHLRAELTAAQTELRSLDQAFEAGASANPSLRALSLVRRADARDAVADRLRTIALPMPADLRRVVEQASPEVQEEVRREWEEQTRAVLAEHARRLWCQAADLYGEALDGEAEIRARAHEQRERYGDAFLSSCAAP